MVEIKVLIEGYAKEIENGWIASSTVSLIKFEGKLIISDPGCNREKLLKALEYEGLKVEDIHFVFLTHGHIDHSLLAGIFKNAKIITFEGLMYEKDFQTDLKDNILGSEIKIINTPGHSPEHISLLVNTSKGKYAIAGDIFWWVDGEKQIVDLNRKDDAHPLELNMKKLISSRKNLLELADYIIPGHGKMFEVEK